MGTYSEKFDFVTSNIVPACVQSVVDQPTVYQITVQRLTSITTAAHTITFTPGALRTDALSPTAVQQEPTLDLITVAAPLPAGTVIRKFKMVYDYSTGRLTLKQILEQDAGNVPLPPFAFSYDPMVLPARTSFSIDHWGFYNGKANTTSIPSEVVAAQSVALTGADRNPDPAFARAGILTKITYPTGGSSQFVYDGNTYGAIGSGAAAPVVPGPLESYAANADLGTPAGSQNFTITGQAGVPIVVDIDVTIVSTCPTGVGCPIAKLLQGASTLGSWTTAGVIQTAFSLLPGVYTLTANATLAGGGSALAHIGAKFRPLVTNYLAPGGGLRVAEVRTDDGMNTPNSVTYTKYNYALVSCAGFRGHYP